MNSLDDSGSFIREPEVSEQALGMQLQALAEKQPVLAGSVLDVEYKNLPLPFHKYLESLFGDSLLSTVNVRYVIDSENATVQGIETTFKKRQKTHGLLEVDKDLSLVGLSTQDTFSRHYTDLAPQNIVNFLAVVPEGIQGFSVDTKSSVSLFSSIDHLLEQTLPVSLRQINSLARFEVSEDISEELVLEQVRTIGPNDIFTIIKYIDTVSQPSTEKGDIEDSREELELYFDQTGTTLSSKLVDSKGISTMQQIDYIRILNTLRKLKNLN